MKQQQKTKHLTTLALLSGIALIIFTVESQLPSILPVPGVKLGLANIITLITLYQFGAKDAFLVLITRVLLGALVTGRIVTLFYSLFGGLLCLLICALLRPLFPYRIWPLSMIGAVFHNLGQLLAACLMTKSAAIMAYFPILLCAGLITGLFTGLSSDFLLPRLKGRRL